jgi:glutamate racemase
MIEAGADVIVLGCTHFPFAAPLIRAAAGPGVEVLDPAVAVAAQLARRLDETGLRADASSTGSEQFYTSGEREHVAAVIAALWGQAVPVAAAPL